MLDEEETVESLTIAMQRMIEILTEQAWFITQIVHSLEDAGIKVKGVMNDKPPIH